ncbi:hypothetical protein [Nocardioides sp.]|uniref:hypothetical protein n=1 Tax=Nocardioides sp. TaxID=35761 RepID=UPI002ED296F5
MKRSTLNLPAAAFAGLVTTGLLALPISSAFAADDVKIKRNDDDTPDLVMVADDDEMDPAAGSNVNFKADNTNTRSRYTSGVNSNDKTNSRHTKVSRDRDRSRGDKTRDWTRDGGDKTRDHSANRTNDRSRNDTRR